MYNDPMFWTMTFFIIGAVFGSFANVLILRVPAKKSILTRSQCMSCQKLVPWHDNIPILSWFILRGKCRHCKTPYSFRYPVVEFVMASLFAAVYYFYGFQFILVEYLIFVFGLVVISFIDLDHFIIPDVFSLSGIVIGLLGALLNPERAFQDALLGCLVGGGFLWAIAYVYYIIKKQEGMGGGDIKLLAWIGAVLGWKAIPFVILVSSIVGSIVGVSMAVKQRKNLKTVIPYGPYLAAAALIYIFGGDRIAIWYFQLFIPGVE